jgi:tetratricopeptide (TPR) repeat protein
VTRSGNRDRLREIVGFAATSLLGSLLFLSTAAELRADAREALQKAVVLVQEGRLEEADQQAQLALSNPRTRAVAYSVLGNIRFQQKRLTESVDLFQKAIRLDPRLLGAHLSLAEVYTIQGEPELALGLYQQILTLDPANATARLGLARSETEKGNYQRSLELAQPILPVLKHSPEGLLVLATDYLKTGNRTAAAELAKDWAQLTDTPPAWSI